MKILIHNFVKLNTCLLPDIFKFGSNEIFPDFEKVLSFNENQAYSLVPLFLPLCGQVLLIK